MSGPTTTPPTDAGSTPREGGEGVTQADRNLAEMIKARTTGYGGTAIRDGEMDSHWLVQACAEHRLATTSSSDASPDSGERTREALRRAVYEDRPFTVISEALAQATGLEMGAAIPFEDALAVGMDDREMQRIIGVVLDRLTASPASLSGGTEDVWRIASEIYAEVADEPLGDLSQRRQAVQDRWCDAVRAALHPSPEAPANRQDAGEVDLVSREMTAFEAAYPLVNTAKYPNGEVVAGRARYDEPDVDKMFGAWLARSTLTSPKDVKGGGR